MTLSELIEEFYRVCYPPESVMLRTVYIPAHPQDMLVGQKNKAGEISWRLVPHSQTIAPEFDDFEREIDCKLPMSFKLWHSRYYTLDGGASIVRLPAIPSNDPFKGLRFELYEIYFPEGLRKKGFLPFASDGNDVGNVCFDTSIQVEDNEYPIYVWEHEGDDNERWLYPMFSNFRKLLECCVHLHGGHLPDYPLLPKGVAGFAVIDPEWAGKYPFEDY